MENFLHIENPIHLAVEEYEKLKKEVIIDVKVAIAREDIRVALSRLIQLDPKEGEMYGNMLAALGE